MARKDFRDLLQQNTEIALDILSAASSSTRGSGGTGTCVTRGGRAVPDSLCDLCRVHDSFSPVTPQGDQFPDQLVHQLLDREVAMELDCHNGIASSNPDGRPF
jgi:hypothetical protein